MIELGKRYLIEELKYVGRRYYCSDYSKFLEEIQVIEISLDEKHVKIRYEKSSKTKWIVIKDLKIKSELFSPDEKDLRLKETY